MDNILAGFWVGGLRLVAEFDFFESVVHAINKNSFVVIFSKRNRDVAVLFIAPVAGLHDFHQSLLAIIVAPNLDIASCVHLQQAVNVARLVRLESEIKFTQFILLASTFDRLQNIFFG